MTSPNSVIHINTKFHWFTFMFSGFRPRAIMNGGTVQLNWGDNAIPAPPGRYEVTVYVPYLWKVGKATTVVDNSAMSPTLYYAAPVWTFQRGAIGFTPQEHPGLIATYILYGVLFALLVLCGAGALIDNLSSTSM